MHPSRLIALALSALLHLAVVAPSALAWRQVDLMEDGEAPLDLSDPDDEGDDREDPLEPLPDVPFHVSLYVEPVPIPVPVASAPSEPAPPAAEPTPVPVVDAPVPALALPLPAEIAVARPAPTPPPEPEPVPEPALSDADRAALDAMDEGEASDAILADLYTEEDDALDEESDKARDRRLAREARRDRKRTHTRDRTPCPEPTESIARVDEATWYIDREFIEYYATHLAELQKLGSVWTHRDKVTKQLDGFTVRLSRCSVLREGGLRSGDIVHDINGRRIHSVLQAIGAYIALRKEPELFVRITRKGQPLVLAYNIEQPARGPEARAERKAARKAAREAARGAGVQAGR